MKPRPMCKACFERLFGRSMNRDEYTLTLERRRCTSCASYTTVLVNHLSIHREHKERA